MKWRQVGVFGLTLLVSVIVAFYVMLTVILTIPRENWPQDFKIIGIGFTVAGAIVSLLPRILREQKEMEAQAGGTYGPNPEFLKALQRDKRFANAGMFVILVGFLLQVLGNSLG